jgi:hypothetical protein
MATHTKKPLPVGATSALNELLGGMTAWRK